MAQKTLSPTDEKFQTWFDQKINLTDPWYQLLLKMIKPVTSFQNKRVLEVGCGLGVFCMHVAKNGGEAIGLDISKSAIMKAKTLTKQYGANNNVEFVVSDAKFLPFTDRSQDIIVSSEVLEHIEGHEKAFHEFARLINKSGYICITVPNLLSSLFFEIVFFKIMGQPKYVQRFLNVENEYVFHYPKVKRLVNSEHLKIIDIKGTDYVHLHPKITNLFHLDKIISIVSNSLENKKSWRFFGANIGVIAQKTAA
ncbi:MAG: methyltransferase domain-containing protein [Candidatus Bathyarchaeota archaeon]|nr:methyltransferase domain-containing protein [Candidatus Termiticorpusculum sp.]